ncbi:MAG: ATP-binding cassette domain-containing protein, partial [Egibacteraceae bacterium]
MLLEVTDVSAAYGPFQVLHGVTLVVAAGEVVALVGANGAGKLTVLKAVAGFLTPQDGSIRLAGE